MEIPSFKRAACCFAALTGIALSKSEMHRLVAEYGSRVVVAQAAEARAMVEVSKQSEGANEVVWRKRVQPDSEVMSVSSDGVLIHVREEGWKEVKVVSISTVQPAQPEDSAGMLEGANDSAGHSVTLAQHSYRAGLWDAATFATHHWAEACRRGVEQARTVVCVSDGAPWIWAVVFMCFARRVEILDFWHATQRLWAMGRHALSSDDDVAQWVALQRSAMAQGDLRKVFRALRLLYPRKTSLPDDVRQAVGYLFNNRRRMHYDAYRKAGYPIGSGTIESACKTLVQARMKQAGMHWSRSGAQNMLALRTLLLSNRWHELASLTAPT